MEFRVLLTEHRTAAENMAIDEAVLNEVAAGNSPPTLRLYGWAPPAISIGYFQIMEEEVDTAACRAHGVDMVRRMTGGGAVLHDKEITYSVHIPESLALVPRGILESYKAVCAGVLNGLTHLGFEGTFAPLNDIVISPRGVPQKISGNAQTRVQGVILQHGTILLEVDVDKMFSLLKVPSEKMKGKLIADIKERVTSLSSAQGRSVSFNETQEAFLKGFAEAFPTMTFNLGQLSPAEEKRAERFKKEKYGNNAWNLKR